MNYVNAEHQMNLTKLISFNPTENRKHDLRVQEYKEDLQEFSTKK
jgi:hypothetical protein